MKNDETLQLIVFTLNGKHLALHTDAMVEVLESVAVSPLPMVPDYIEGLINANGQIIPLLNLSRFSFPEHSAASDGSTLLVIRVKNSLIALRVGMVQEPLEISADVLDECDDAELQAGHFSGKFSHNDHDVCLFDLSCLDGVVVSSEPEAGEAGFLGEPVKSRDDEEVLNEYLLLKVRSQVLACPLNQVYEVIDLTEISAQQGAPAFVAGVGLIRDVPTLILDMSKLLSITDGDAAIDNEAELYSLVIFRSDTLYFALLIDSIVGLELLSDSQITTDKDGQSAIIDENNGSVTPVVSLNELCSEEQIAQLKPFMPSLNSALGEERIKTREILRFYMEGDAYGLYLRDVRRILAYKPVESLLDKHHHLMGTIEVEGKVLPVINLAGQLDYGDVSAQEFVVVNDGQSDWALAIPLTDQILHLPENRIEVLEREQATYFQAFSSVDESLISILDVAAICRPNAERIRV